MMQNPLDGFVYYVNIFNGTLYKISFEGPTWTNEPVDITLQCEAISNPTDEFNNWLSSFSGTVLCGNATLTNDNSGLNMLCGSTASQTVVFTLSDDCGNEITKSATFTIEDNENPTFNEALPSNTTVACDNIPLAETLTADDTCGIATVSFSESTVSGLCSGAYTITRTWTATDECLSETVHVQTITVEDNIDPVWDVIPSNITVGCSPNNQMEFEAWLNSFSGTDICGIATISHDAPATISCSEAILVTFELSDECGNSTSNSATFTVEGTLSNPKIEETTIIMYPNPAEKYMYVKGLDECSVMEVFNIAGQKVLRKPVINGILIEFDLNAGLYLVKISSSTKTEIKKLIIN
jgi:hypothetical protein